MPQISLSEATYKLLEECKRLLEQKYGATKSDNMTVAEVCLGFLSKAKKEKAEGRW